MELLTVLCIACFITGIFFCRACQFIYSKLKIKPTGRFVSLLVGKETQYVGILPGGRIKFLEVKKKIRQMYPVLRSSTPKKPADITGVHKRKEVISPIKIVRG